ncbi:hypothetical protein FE257_005638 [Aspergillus nanangensis]|uniref:Inhibitor I9 domain-containing protein n=1 Tax=Aspergillus nanangensis TaxID=2582783 RepID=A0AAD4CQE1_ASPNN|nr:hypothetical protein FE257_005638 [Aspergillus nanangensis]
MPLYNVTLKKDVSPEKLAEAKAKAVNNGGTLKHEFTLIKGFTVEYPEDHVGVLESDDHIHVEQDGEVKIQ